MALTAEQLLEITGLQLPDDATPETAKELFGKSYVATSLHESELSKWKKSDEDRQKEIDKAIGKFKGSTESVLKRAFGDSVKDVSDWNELLQKAEETANATRDEIARLTKLSSGKHDEVIAELKEKYSKEIKDLREMNLSFGNKEAEYQKAIEEAKADAESRVNKFLENQAIEKIYKEAKWSDIVNDYTKKGLWADEIEGKFIFKSEGDKVLVFDKDGGIVRNGAVQKTADVLFNEILDSKGLMKKNGAESGTQAKLKEGVKYTPQQLEHIAKMKAHAESQMKK